MLRGDVSVINVNNSSQQGAIDKTYLDDEPPPLSTFPVEEAQLLLANKSQVLDGNSSSTNTSSLAPASPLRPPVILDTVVADNSTTIEALPVNPATATEEQPAIQTSNSMDGTTNNNLYVIYFLLGTFSFFYLMDPSAPFFVQYLTKEKHISVETIIDSIFPIWSYSYPFVQFFIGLACEIRQLGHKYVIGLGLFFNAITILLIFLCNNSNYLWLVQASEVTFSIQFAAHQAFAGLRYHLVAAENYQFITSITRACMLLGHTFGAVIGQLLLLFSIGSLNIHFCLALVLILPCYFICMCAFPAPSQYRNKMPPKKSLKDFLLEILQCYSKTYSIVIWSFIAIACTAVHQLGLTYYQTLFKTIDPEKTYNGFIISVAYLVASVASFVPAKLNKLVTHAGRFIAIVTILVLGTCLLLLGLPNTISLYAAYVIFVVYHALFEFLFVLCSSQIAQALKVTRFAAIFSLNAMAQNICQFIIQFIIGNKVLHLDTLGNYRAFAYLSFGIATVTSLLVLAEFVYNRLAKRN